MKEILLEFLSEFGLYLLLAYDSIVILIQSLGKKKESKTYSLTDDRKSMLEYHKKMVSLLEKEEKVENDKNG